MKPRMNFYQAAPDTIKALIALEAQIQASGLEQSLIELVKTRASQINGCAFCINMHTQDARKHGETEQRLYLLNAWREVAALYRPRTRRAGLDRGGDADLGNPRARRRLRGGPRPVLGSRDGQPDHADRDHQCLEPARDQLPRGASGEGQGRGGVSRQPRARASSRRGSGSITDVSERRPALPARRHDGGRTTPPSPWRTRHRSRAAGRSSGRACRRRPSCRRSTPPPARTRWRW